MVLIQFARFNILVLRKFVVFIIVIFLLISYFGIREICGRGHSFGIDKIYGFGYQGQLRSQWDISRDLLVTITFYYLLKKDFYQIEGKSRVLKLKKFFKNYRKKTIF
jgi:hypothetical protein